MFPEMPQVVSGAKHQVWNRDLKGITAHTYPDRSPCSSPGALGRQVGGGCALGIRSMIRRAGATVRSCLHLAESLREDCPGREDPRVSRGNVPGS